MTPLPEIQQLSDVGVFSPALATNIFIITSIVINIIIIIGILCNTLSSETKYKH